MKHIKCKSMMIYVFKVFPIIDLNNDGLVTCEEITLLTWNDLKAVAGEVSCQFPVFVCCYIY